MLYDVTVPQLMKMLHNLNAILDKATKHAEAKSFDTSVFCHARLAPDQFNFIKQIQITCDTAKLGVSRLTAKDAPSHADDEKSFADLKARIESTMAYLEGFSAQDFAEAATRHISTPRWDGQYLTGQEFATQHLIPNFYFHLTTSYAILRHNGVDVGKKDYLGAMPFKK